MRDLVTLNDDIHQAKGSITQLQAAMSQVLKRTPTVTEFNEIIKAISLAGDSLDHRNEDRFLLDKLKQTLNTPQLKVAMKFKQLFEMDELPFLKMLALIHLKVNKDFKEPAEKEEVLNFLLEYHRSEESKNLGNDVDSNELKQFNEDLTAIKEDESGSIDGLKVNSKGDLDIQLPDLLAIKDDKMFKRVFLHRSFIDPVVAMENLQDSSYDNSKLIVRGRVTLQWILLEIIMQKYPKLYHEDMILLVGQLMDENILFKLSLTYNLVDNFKFKISNRMAMGDKLQMIAEIFLGYIGGLSYEYSRCRMKLWTYSIYKWILPSVIKDEAFDNSEFLCKQFKFLLNQLPIEYNFEKVEQETTVYKLTVVGEEYMGTNSNEAKAQVNAVNQFLEDKKITSELIKQYHQQQENKELQQGSQEFRDFVKERGIDVNYNQIKLNDLHHLTIKIDELILSSTFDRDEIKMKMRGETSALENLRVLTSP